MKVLVAGGAGFVGHHLVPALCGHGHEVTVLSRKPWHAEIKADVNFMQGDALDPASYRGKLARYDAIINLIAIIREFPDEGITYERYNYLATKYLADAARDNGVRLWLQMSANGASPDGISEYQTAKWRAEEYLKGLGFRLTVFRPSLIFGPPPAGKTEFCTQMADLMRGMPVVPMFGSGNYRLQPVSVREVAAAFTAALDNNISAGKTYHLGGEESFTYRETLEIIRQGAGLMPKLKMPVPYSLVRPAVSFLQKYPSFPATVDQLDMLLQGNTVPETAFRNELGINPPVPFNPESLSYLARGSAAEEERL